MTRPEWYTGVVQRAGCLTASTQTANVNSLLIDAFLREVSEGERGCERGDSNPRPPGPQPNTQGFSRWLSIAFCRDFLV
jgi:hypothetical protein